MMWAWMRGRMMELKASGGIWVKGPDGPAACRAGWGLGVQSFSTFDWSVFPWLLGREGPLLLSASSPSPSFYAQR